jgi:hypothetical protein
MVDAETDVRQRFSEVKDRLASACREAGRDPGAVALVAVSKRQPEARLAAAIALGHRDFGENYPQELARKQAEHPEARWHFVGRLQRNKAKLVADAALIHGLDSEKLARALDRQGAGVGRTLPVLIQVHQGGEASKAGVEPAEVGALLEATRALDHVEVQGLMTLPPPGEGRRHFAELRELRDRLRAETGLALPHLSMGMSDDFEDAIAEGATIVRIGTALFGPRPE